MGKPDSSENGEDPVRAEYSLLASDYDTRWSFYIESSHLETFERIKAVKAERILDVGCGTGVLLRKLAETYPDVKLTGIDTTQEMLDLAREKLTAAVDLRLAAAESLPFESDSFDAVIACNMFHYIRKPAMALEEIKRVLKPGAVFVLTDWCDDYIACKLCDFYLRLFDTSHFRTYGKEECHDLLVSSGLTDINVTRYKISWLWGMMTATGRKKML